MDAEQQILVFGDGVPEIHNSIRKLYNIAPGSPWLSKYLDVYSASLQAATDHVPYSERGCIIAKDLRELSENHIRNGSQNTAVTFLLTSGLQLGWLFAQLDSEPGLLQYTRLRVILGFCMGLLPSLAAAISKDARTLLHVTPEIIRLSLELGLHLVRRANAVEQTMESWATAVFGMAEKEALEILSQFHKLNAIPLHKRAWISAVFPTSPTISAPPSTLHDLWSGSERLSKTSKFRIAAALAIHAAHINMPDLDALLIDSPLRSVTIPSNTFLISPSSGQPLNITSSFRDAFLESAAEIFQRPMRWERIEASLKAFILQASFKQTNSRISIMGLTGVSKLLRAAFGTTRMRVVADEDAQTGAENPGSDANDIAIVGMAGRFPGAESLEDFWQTLEKGLDLHRRIPPDRFNADAHYDPIGKTANSSLTQFGCFIDKPGHFDRRLFRMSPTEAKQTDPMQRLQLLTAYEALEMAGYSYDRTSATNHKRIATFFGQSCDDYRQTNAAQEINTFYIPGGARAFGPGRVSYHFGWEGPSYSIDTACSASIASIHLASQALHSQECDTAVVSAANILTTPDNFAGLTRGGFVSTTAACKTLDQTADGYCRADAVCTLVLKRLSNAIADNDNVHAVIKATGLNSAAQAISITHPHAGSQADLFTKTLRQADLVPDDIIHFELHGTGTQGSQKPGMAKELFAASQIFRESIESSAKICHDIGYKKLLDYLILPNEAILDDNIGAQLALVAFELALATMWQSLGLVPQAVIGHSLGEYSALCVAGTLSVTVTLYLVYHRARLLHEHCSSGTHAMLSTLASPQEVGQYRKKFGTSAELCCANGPRSTVVGGFKNDIDHLSIELLSNDIKTSIIELPFAFHTRSVEKILPEFGVHCEQIRLKRPKVPFGSSLLGTFIEDNEELPPNYLSRQTREPVLFAKALIQGFEADIVGKDMTWIEIGPSTTCLTFIKTTLSIDERYLLPSSSSSHSQDSVARSLAQAYRNGLDLSWSEYHRQHERCLNLLELPSYAFDLENYWIQYRGNWSLLKDRRRPEQSSEMYLGPTLHKLVKERNEGGSRTFEFETDTENEDFRQI